jgi:hypothetical protein
MKCAENQNPQNGADFTPQKTTNPISYSPGGTSSSKKNQSGLKAQNYMTPGQQALITPPPAHKKK